MVNKLLVALALMLSIFICGNVFISSWIGRPLQPSELTRFSSAIVLNTILHHGENGGSATMQLAREAFSAPLLVGSADVGGHHHEFPLAKYSIRCKERRSYLTFSLVDELDKYFHTDLRDAGWQYVDQFGAIHQFKKDGAAMIVSQQFYLGTSISEVGISIVEN